MTNREKKIILKYLPHFSWKYEVNLADPFLNLCQVNFEKLQEICSWGSISVETIGDQEIALVFGGTQHIAVDVNDIEVSDPRDGNPQGLPEYIRVRVGDVIVFAYESDPDAVNRKVDYELMDELIRELNALPKKEEPRVSIRRNRN